MSDKQIFEKVMERYQKSTGDDRAFVPSNDIIIFLEKEIDSYREKIAHLEACVDGMKERTARLEQTIGKMYGECIKVQPPEVLKAVQENTAREIIKTLSDSGFDSISINIYKSKEE